MSKIPAINEIDANSPSQESTEVVVKATTVTPDINEIQETISSSATIQEIDGTRKPTISEIYKIVNDGLFESTTNWWDYAYKLSQAQINQDIISRLDNGVIGGGYSKGVDIITTTSNKVPSNTNVYSALKSDSLYPKKLNDEVINGIYDFLNGLTIGKPTAYTGGTWSVDQTGRTHLTTDYLYVRLKAIFETLQILNVDTIGGKLVISPAGSIRVAYVDRIKIDAPVFTHNEETDVWSISQVEDEEGNLVNETLNQEVYRCYFLGEQDGEEIDNKWKVGDQAQAKTFNVKKGTYHKVENSYLWRLVVNVSSDTVDIDGKKYHYVDLSQIDFDSGSDAPAPGDILNQLGHRLNDAQRQTALVLNAVDNYAPSITLYAGVNYYTLLNKEYVEFGVYNGKAFFNVYGDMYIGDKGENPKTYIKYKNGKINIKANLEIGSSIGDKDLDQYIKENGGVDEETVKNLINNAQVIKDLQNQADGAIETWFYEGIPTLDNLPAVDWTTNDIKKVHIGDLYYDQITGYAYRFTKYNDDVNPYRWNRIKDNDIVAALEAASHAQATADDKMKVFYGETKPTNYKIGDMWVNATLEGKFNNDIARAVADNETFNANDWVLASRYSEAIATIQKWTNEYETKFSNLVDEVKQQKDQSIVVWYYSYEPTVDNIPANTWNTNDLRSEHIGDIFYDIENNHSYRWTGTAWVQIKDADFDKAMKAAKDADNKAGAAGDLADSKRRIFYSDTTPTEPFDKGDLWIKQVGDKTETWVYNGTNWVKSEDKDLADFSAAINEELAGIKGQLDGKAETWYQNTDPSKSWTDKASHEGDIWYNTTNGTTNYWNGSAWEQMDIPKDVFDTIDGKSSIFVDSYADAKAGTGVICKGYKERDLWILPEDATVNGVKYYKGDMLTAVSNNTNFDETNWKKKVRYVGQAELTNAIDIVNDKINTINNTTIPGINNKFNEFVKDGVLDSSEKARLTDLLNQASNEVAAVVDQVNNITTSKYLTNDNANKGKLEEANTVMNTAWTEYSTFINTLISANTEITKVNIGEANTKYKNLQEKIKAVKQYLAICQADILSGMGTDITSYKYLKEAFKGKTEVNGGLVVTNVLQLRQTSDASSPVTAGISGLQGKANADGVVDKDTYDITSIAAWFGGPMVDKDIFTDEQLNNKVAGTDYARSLFRHDGSGYLANGAIYWGTDGVLHGDPNSFILQGTSIATMFYYTRLFYLHYANQNTTDFNKIDYVTPMKTFSRLSVLSLGGVEGGNRLPTGLFIGDSKTGGSFQIGNIILRTKSGDPNILEIVSATDSKIAHLGVQGGVSAYGTYTPSTGGGGGLNATVVSYANIISGNYNDTDLTRIPNAYSVKALSNRIDNIATELGGLNLSWNNITGKPSSFTPSAHVHSWDSIIGKVVAGNEFNIVDAGFNGDMWFNYVPINDHSKTATVLNYRFGNGNKGLASLIASGFVKNGSSDSYVLLGGGGHRTISSLSVNYASSAGNADTVDGVHMRWSHNTRDTRIPVLSDNNLDYILKSELVGQYNSASATKLQTPRNIWGQSFDGTSDINGNIIVPSGKYISIGNIKMEYDVTNKALKIINTTTNELANLYTSGIVPYSTAIASDPQNEGSKIASASSIYKLHSRIFAIENNGATSITVTGTGNAITSVSKNGTSITFTKGATFLTSHQSLAGYATQAWVNNKRYITANDNITGNAATATKLKSTVKIFGNDFDGTNNIGGYIQVNENFVIGVGNEIYNSKDTLYINRSIRGGQNVSICNGAGNVAIGGDNFKHKLNVAGDTSVSGILYANKLVGNLDYSYIRNHPSSFPASDVYAWAKAATKPSYSWNEINNRPTVVSAFTNDAKYLSKTLPLVNDANDAVGDIGFSVFKLDGNVVNSNKYGDGFITSFNWGGNYCSQLFVDADPRYGMMIRHRAGDAVWNSWKEIITENNIMNQHVNISDNTYNVIGERFNLDLNSKGISILKFINVNGDRCFHFKVVRIAAYDIEYRESEVSVSFTNRNINEVYINCVGNALTRCRIFLYNGEFYLAMEGEKLNYGYTNLVVTASNIDFNHLFTTTTLKSIPDNVTFGKYNVLNTLSKGNGRLYYDGDLTVNGLISNKGILPANYEFNNKGTSCYVSADALCSGITSITDSIPITNVDIHYSNDNGTNWTKYSMPDDTKFNLYANNAGYSKIYLGYNVIPSDIDPNILNRIKDEAEKLAQIKKNEAEKLAQIKKNQLMFTFYIPNSCYSQPYFASVDISNGINTICTVEILNNSGAVVDTYTKHMIGWNQVNYISLLHDSNAGSAVGNNDRRYIRFKFKHDQNTTNLRNTMISKIRIFSFTKYSFPTDRFMGHTGHIYNFDYNMNTYFPNSILAKGGVTAYQSSDVRLKTNITKLNCLNVIKSIGGTYEFDYIRDHKHSIGFIAQNVNNPLLNDIVAKDDNGYLKINYWNPKLISLAFGALTEIDDEVDKLKARVRELESEVEYLKNKDYVLQ